MLSCTKMEYDNMTSEKDREKAAAERKQARDQRPPSPPPPQVSPPLGNDGPELVRDSHC
jgi:hypothetical protein